MNKLILCRVICVCCLFAADVSGAIIHRPLNVATITRDETVFNCSSDKTDNITWSYTKDCNITNGTPLTDSSCNVISGNYTFFYRTEKPDGFTCSLIVFHAVLSLGGCYACTDGTGEVFQAMLIMIDRVLHIGPNVTDIIPGDGVALGCAIYYKGPSIPLQPLPPLFPWFYWTQGSETGPNVTTYHDLTTNTRANGYITVVAQAPKVGPYFCNLFFNPPSYALPSCASNTPTYERGSGPVTYYVSHPPNNVTISGAPTPCLHRPVILACQSAGHPTPTYQWLNTTDGDILSQSNAVIISRGGSYQCVASNTIRDVPYNASSIIVSVSDCESPHNVRINASCDEPNSITLTCEASGFPQPEYKWSFSGGSAIGPTMVAKKNIAYECTATNNYADQQHSDSAALHVYWLEVLTCVNVGLSDPVCITMLVLVIFFGLNLLSFVIFIIGYGCSESGSDTLNDRFPWLKKMLPCLNGEGCTRFQWIFLFAILSVFTSIVFFPTLMIVAHCCQKKTKTNKANIHPRQEVYIYENVMTPNTSPEPVSYESLQLPTVESTAAAVYEELTKRH